MSDVFDSKAFLKTVTSQPGVYRMYDAGGTVIYVGKAKDLKKRLSSYFRSNLASRKTEALVSLIQNIDVTVTHTETEALLLEHNYIKLYQPRYNVLQTFVSMAAVSNAEFWNELVATYGDKYPELKTPEGRTKALKRGQWATSEMVAYLGLCEQLNLDPFNQKGSFSGAMGPGQFMPTSFVRFGVDGDADGVKNPFSMNDMLASIANYLSLAGWNSESDTAKRQAVWSYNHHEVYVNSVLNLAAELATPPVAPIAPAASVALADTRITVLFDDGSCLLGNGMRALRAVSCLVEPQIGELLRRRWRVGTHGEAGVRAHRQAGRQLHHLQARHLAARLAQGGEQ